MARLQGRLKVLTVHNNEKDTDTEAYRKWASIVKPSLGNVIQLEITGKHNRHMCEIWQGQCERIERLAIRHSRYYEYEPERVPVKYLCAKLLHPECTTLRHLVVERATFFCLDVSPQQMQRLQELNRLDAEQRAYGKGY